MGLLRDTAFAAAGYCLSEFIHGDRHKSDNLYEIIDEYARNHGVYYTNQEFYEELMEIAQRYKP